MSKRTLFLILPVVLALGVSATLAQGYPGYPGYPGTDDFDTDDPVATTAVVSKVSNANPAVGETVYVTTTFTDSLGAPVANAAGTARVEKSPGGGGVSLSSATSSQASASALMQLVQTVAFMTDANGQATVALATGDTPGEIRVVFTLEGDPTNPDDDLEARATIIVGDEIKPPDTGTGTGAVDALGEGGSAPTALLMAGLLASALVVAGIGAVAVQRRR